MLVMPSTSLQNARVRAMYAHAGLPGAEMTLYPKDGVGFKRYVWLEVPPRA